MYTAIQYVQDGAHRLLADASGIDQLIEQVRAQVPQATLLRMPVAEVSVGRRPIRGALLAPGRIILLCESLAHA